jgi:hypothetical protein
LKKPQKKEKGASGIDHQLSCALFIAGLELILGMGPTILARLQKQQLVTRRCSGATGRF